MPMPLAIDTLMHNARQEIVISQVFAGVIAIILGPTCLIMSFLPTDATSEYRIFMGVGGIIICGLLVGLIFETRRRLARVDRLMAVLQREEEDQVVSIFPYKQKSGLLGSYKLQVELKDGTLESLPVAEKDYNTLLAYFRTKYPYAIREPKEDKRS